MHIHKKQRGKTEKRKGKAKPTNFHLLFHFSQEAGVEWKEATWVAAEVDPMKEFWRNKEGRNLGISIEN